MMSFGYRFNPRYAIKECLSCGTLYTRDCVCSIWTVEDKILVPKPPKNCARCTRCGYLVDGPNCQGCAFFRQELKENLVTYPPDFQNSSETSIASTNVVNAHREPYVVKQDNGSFIDKIIFDFNRAPDSPDQFHCFHCKVVLRAWEACKRYKIIFDLNRAPDSPHLHTISPNQFHCFHYKDVLSDGEACKRCTCAKCGSGLGEGLCYICRNYQNSLNDSPRISKTSSQSPPHINHCCYECGDPLDGIFCKRCTCKSCGKDAHIGYNYPPTVPVGSNPEPCNNQTIDELPQTLPSFHPTFHSEAEIPFTLDSTPTYVDESPNVFNPPPQSFVYPCEFCGNDAYYGHYYDDDDEERSDSLDDNIISGLPPFFAITPNEPVLSTEEPDNSLSMGDEHLDTIPKTESNKLIKSSVKNLIPIPSESEGIPEHMCDVPSHDNSLPLDVSKDQIEDFSESNEEFSSIDDDSFSSDDIDYVEASPPDSELVISEVMEIVIPEVGGIDDDIVLMIKDDILREKLLNVNLLIDKIKALNANPTPSSDCKTKSPSTSLNSLLEETNTFDNSLPEFETYCFDVEEISSDSTTTPPDISLPKYEAFHDDHLNSTLAKIKDQMTSITSLCEMACQVAQKKLEEKQIEEEQAAKAKYWKLPVCYDDDDDEEISYSLNVNIISGLPLFSAITPDEPVLSTEDMREEHLDTILTTESDEFIKSGVENLISIPSESKGILEHVCDVPSHDNSPPLDVSKYQIEDFSESNNELSSIDDDSFSIDNIDYVEASPPDSELVSSEVMEIVIPK
nr:hypothetical protein [Tanacetum cinerariifolium]